MIFAPKLAAGDHDPVGTAGPAFRKGVCLTFLTADFFAPPTGGRVRDVVLAGDLVERHVGEGELLREVRHRLGPDEVVELLAGEDPGHCRSIRCPRGTRRDQ